MKKITNKYIYKNFSDHSDQCFNKRSDKKFRVLSKKEKLYYNIIDYNDILDIE